MATETTKQLREQLGLLTQKQVAEQTGISPQLFFHLVRTGVIEEPKQSFGQNARKYYSIKDAQKIIKEFKR